MIPPKQEKGSMPKSQSLPLAALLPSRWNKQNFYIFFLHEYAENFSLLRSISARGSENMCGVLITYDLLARFLSQQFVHIWFIKRLMVEFASNSSSSISAAALNTRVPKYQGHSCRLKEDGADFQIRPWRSAYKPPPFPSERSMETDEGGGGGTGRQGGSGRRTLCTELRIRRARENFNSAAVATNRRPLINRDVCEMWACRVGGGGVLPLGWLLPVRTESGSSELSTGSLISSGQEWQRERDEKNREEEGCKFEETLW